jgi:hypothetical protein
MPRSVGRNIIWPPPATARTCVLLRRPAAGRLFSPESAGRRLPCRTRSNGCRRAALTWRLLIPAGQPSVSDRDRARTLAVGRCLLPLISACYFRQANTVEWLLISDLVHISTHTPYRFRWSSDYTFRFKLEDAMRRPGRASRCFYSVERGFREQTDSLKEDG